MLKSRFSVVFVVAILAASVPGIAEAKPSRPPLGPAIDPSPGYEGQSKCRPTDKPGVVAFRKLVLRAIPEPDMDRSAGVAESAAPASTKRAGHGTGASTRARCRRGGPPRVSSAGSSRRTLTATVTPWLDGSATCTSSSIARSGFGKRLARLLQAEAQGLRIAQRRWHTSSSHRSRALQFHLGRGDEAHDLLESVALDDFGRGGTSRHRGRLGCWW